MDFLEYPDVFKEDKGSMNPGRLKLTNQGVIFKNSKTGKVDTVQGADVDNIKWQRLSASCGIRIMMKSGVVFRFGGFVDNDNEKLTKFFKHNFDLEMKPRDLCLKGWNWGTAKFQGNLLSFTVEKSTAYEIPLKNVSHCTTAKNEVTLEFHQNDDAAVSLMELRFHIPSDATQTVDSVQAFHENIMSKASIIQATGDAIAVFKELQCLTPRGRYDIKMFPSFIQLHGKTFDYKIPLTTVLRLFLLPHKDGRQMYFVLSLDPPIKQGQTRYHFLILLFNKEDETTVSVGLSDEDLKEKYEDKLQKEMSGPTFEVLSRVMKALVQRKITVPGSFTGHSGTNAITCSYRAGNGLLYPLERGLIYIHKPPVHIRFEEISTLNFARSGGSTRSFDIEVETKSGVVHTFSSIEKEEYSKLFDFASSKKLRIKNRTDTGSLSGKKKPEKPNYRDDDELVDSDLEDEPDAYLQRVKAEGRQREEDGGGGGGGSSDESSDVSFNPGDNSGSEVAEEFDSNAPSSEDSDEDGKAAGGGGSDTEKKKKKKSKSAKTVKEPGTRKKRVKKEKDENRPKRPQSSYFLWLGDIRETIKQEHPGISITDLSKRAGEMWKEVKDKTKWDKKAQEAKKDYEKAMAEYKASGGDRRSPVSSDKKTEKKSSSSSRKEPEKNVSPTKIKSKEYISSEDSSASEDDKPLKKKKPEPKKGKPIKKEVKKEKSDEEKSDEGKDDADEEEEEILSTPTSSEKDEDMEEGSD